MARLGRGGDGAAAGAAAAAEAAAIAASLGGVPDLGLPAVGMQSGAAPLGSGPVAFAQPSVSQAVTVLVSNEAHDAYRLAYEQDGAGAPAPLPRLSGPGGEMRIGNPTEATVLAAEASIAAATAMAAAERGASASTGSSWVAPPVLGGSGFALAGLPQSLAPPQPIASAWSFTGPSLSEASRLPPAPTNIDVPRQAATLAAGLAGYADGGVAPVVNCWVNGVPCAYDNQDWAYRRVPEAPAALQEPRGRQPEVAVPQTQAFSRRLVEERSGPVTPRLVNEQVTYAAQATVPQFTAEAERVIRSRSVPMTPTSRTRLAGLLPAAAQGSTAVWSSVSPVPAVSAYPCPVWPPPPLPPVSCELQARLEALEAQKKQSIDIVREKRLAELKLELDTAQVSMTQAKTLEQQLEQTNIDWKVKLEVLEARFQENEAASLRRLEEAEREAEARGREEINRLSRELQAIRSESDRAVDDVERRGQDEIARLRAELQAQREKDRSARETVQRYEIEISQLRSDLELQQDAVSQASDKLRKLERTIQEKNEELDRERAEARRRSSSVQDQQRSFEVELTKLTSDSEELRLKLKKVVEERDMLDSDLQHYKKANAQREEECKNLRASISEERNLTRLLQRELETRKAEVNVAEKRESIISRQSLGGSSGFQGSRQGSMRGSAAGMIDVDLTDDVAVSERAVARTSGASAGYAAARASQSYESQRRASEKVVTTTYEVDVEVSASGSESSSYSGSGSRR